MSDILEAQKIIVGSIFYDKDCIKEIYGILEPVHFTEPVLKKTYNTMLYLYNRGEPCNMVSVSNLLKNDGMDSDYLLGIFRECLDEIITTAEIKYHANILITEHKRKEYARIIHQKQIGSVDDVIGNVISQLTSLLENRETTAETISDIYEKNKEKYFNPDYNPNYLYFGINAIDKLVGGLEETDMMCIGARPAVGKSAFAFNLAMNVSQAKKVKFYSFEMNKKQILDRALARESKVDIQHIRREKKFQNKDEEVQFQYGVKDIVENKNLIIDDKPKTVDEIRSECKYLDNLGLIIIDYLQLMKLPASAKYGTRTEAIGQISRGLRQLALEINVPIVILSQLNRNVETRDNKRPTLADLRESGDIEQDCCVVAFLWNIDENDKSKKGIAVNKNRLGTTGISNMLFKGEYMEFYDMDNMGTVDYSSNKSNKKNDGFMSLVDCEQEELPFK